MKIVKDRWRLWKESIGKLTPSLSARARRRSNREAKSTSWFVDKAAYENFDRSQGRLYMFAPFAPVF